jgi:hypothetical protein
MSTKNNLSNSIVAQVLGGPVVKSLLKGNAVALGQGGPALTFYSTATFPRHTSLGVVIGAHISGEDQRKIEGVTDAKALIYLPWNEDEAREYLTTWHPTVIGPSKLQAEVDILPAEVEAALEQLTWRINLSTGLGHPLDKAAAVRMVQALQAGGHSLDAKAIGRWALRHGWSSTSAAKLEDLVKKG